MYTRSIIFTLLFIFISGMLFGQSPAKSPSAASNAASSSSAAQLEQGKLLVGKDDCATCHQPSQRIVGPSYNEIAAKYPATENAILYLAQKIRHGGSGVWGETEMASHVHLNLEQAKAIARYVLSLK